MILNFGRKLFGQERRRGRRGGGMGGDRVGREGRTGYSVRL
jgi:hypothetical protein